MSVISEVVLVEVDATTPSITQIGYGTPLIVSHNAAWTERVREYGTSAAVLLDFAATTPEYLAAVALFSAARRPPTVLIGRANANKPTQQFQIIPTAVHLATYVMKAGTSVLSYTADAATTASEIITGLKALIDALAIAVTVSETAAGGGAGTGAMKIVANTAGAFFSFSTTDANLALTQNHAAVATGLATELALINIERSDWYGLLTLYNSKLYVEQAAAWANSNGKLYVFQTQDGDVPNTVLSGATDVVSTLKALSYDHVAAIFSKATADFADAAWFGRCLPLSPGTETWMFKVLVGVAVGSYTATQRTNMRAKFCNFYENTQGQPMTENGKVVSGAFIDFIRYIDSLKSNIAFDVFTPLVEEDKIPFNDNGFVRIETCVAGRLQIDEKRGVLNSGWTTTIPKRADISSADSAARLLDGVEFTAVYSGAIHKVEILGRVTQ